MFRGLGQDILFDFDEIHVVIMSKFVTKGGLECLEIVLKKSIVRNEDWLKKLTTIFESCKIIKSDTSKEIFPHLGQTGSNCDEIIDIIIKSIGTGENIKRKYFEKLRKFKDFPGGSLVSSAVEYFGSAVIVSQWMRWLVTSWDDLERPEVQAMVAKEWSNCKWEKEQWVLQFIMKCAKDKQIDKVELMTDKIKSLLQQLAASSKQQEKQSLENPDQDEFSSFVTIGEADVQELQENMEQSSVVQTPVEDRTHREMIECILKEYFTTEIGNLMKLISLFKDVSLITAENYSNAMKNTEEQRFSASQLMEMVMIDSSVLWKERMIAACEHSEFPGDKAFASIIKTLLKKEVIGEEIQWFISMWNQVTKSNILLKGIIADTWKEECQRLIEYDRWPLYLYETCVLSEDEKAVKEFISKVHAVLPKYGASNEDSECGDIEQDDLHLSPDSFSDDEEEYSKLKKQSGKEEVEIASSVQEGNTDTLIENDEKQSEVKEPQSSDIEKTAFTDEKDKDENDSSSEEEQDAATDDDRKQLETGMTESSDIEKVEPTDDLVEADVDGIQVSSIDKDENSEQAQASVEEPKASPEDDDDTVTSSDDSVKDEDESDSSSEEEQDAATDDDRRQSETGMTKSSDIEKVKTTDDLVEADVDGIQVSSIDMDENSEQAQASVEESVADDGTVTSLEENKDWLNDSMNLLENQYDVIKPILEYTWSSDEELLDQDNWLSSLVCKFDEEENVSTLDSFVKNVKNVLKTDASKENLKEEYDESIKWLNKSLSHLKANKEIFQQLAISFWPELAAQKSRWPSSIIIRYKKETDLAKVVELVVKMKTILVEKEYEENKEWLNKLTNVLKSEHSNIKLLVESMWPDNPDLVTGRWPMSFIRECNSGEDKEKVNEFVRRAKEIMKAETEKHVAEDSKKSDSEREPVRKSDMNQQIQPGMIPRTNKHSPTAADSKLKGTTVQEKPNLHIKPGKSREYSLKMPDNGKDQGSDVAGSSTSTHYKPVAPPRTHQPKIPKETPTAHSQRPLDTKERDLENTSFREMTSKSSVPAKTTLLRKVKKIASGKGGSKESKFQKEMNANKDWIHSSYEVILDSADIALPIAHSIWRDYTHINNVNQVLESILKESSAAKLNQFVFDLKPKLKQKKRADQGAVAERTRAQTKDSLQENRKWIATRKDNLVFFKSHFVPLATKIWPYNKSISENWPNNLISCAKKETDAKKIEDFVEEAMAILKKILQNRQEGSKPQTEKINEDKKEWSSNVDAHIEEDADLKDGIVWMQTQANSDLMQFRYFLMDVVRRTWPDKAETIADDHLWPLTLINVVKESKEKDKVKEFIRKMKNIIEMIKKQQDVEPELHVDNELGRTIEFRVVLSQSMVERVLTFSPPKTFCIISDLWNWSSRRMNWDERHQCFHLKYWVESIPHSFEYKYWSDGEWEYLPSNAGYGNRKFDGTTAYHGKIILFDVVQFPHQTLDLERMSLHLPRLIDLTDGKRDLSQMIDEIHTWVLQMKTGWNTSYRSINKPQRTTIENAMNKWIDGELMPAWNKKEYIPIICCLALCNALAVQNYEVKDKSLLISLFTVLSTEKLRKEDYKALYGELLSQFLNNDERSHLTSIPDTVAWLLLLVEANPIPQFLFSLPLYWLVVKGGEFAERVPRGDTIVPRLSRSCLPLVKIVKWDKIQDRICDYHQQSDLLQLESRIRLIAELNPWIMQAFEYLLKYDSIMSYITKKSDILFYFVLETIVRCLHLRFKVTSWDIRSFIEAEPFVELLFDEVVRRLELPDAKKRINEIDIAYLLKLIEAMVKLTDSKTPTKQDNQVVLGCLRMTNKVLDLSKAMEKSEMNSNYDETFLEGFLRNVLKELEKTCVNANQIQHWNELMNLEWADPVVLKSWQSKLRDTIDKVIKKNWNERDKEFLEFYTQSLIDMQFHDILDRLLQIRAENAFENLLNDKNETSNYFNWQWFGRSETQHRITKIYDSFVSKQIKKYQPLEFMMKWPQLIPFFKQHYKNKFKGFSKDTIGIIEHHIGTFNTVMRELISGEIRVNELDMIKKRGKRCQEMCKYTAEELARNYKLEELIRFRSKQLDGFYKAKESLSVFLQCCELLKQERIVVDKKALDDAYAKDIKYTQLSKIVHCSDDESDKTITVIFYDSVVQKFDEIMSIGILENNLFYHHCWKFVAEEMIEEWLKDTEKNDEGFLVITWERVLQELWVPVKKKLLSKVLDLDKGTLHVSEIFERLDGCSEMQVEKQIKQLYDFSYDSEIRLQNLVQMIDDIRNLMKAKMSCAVNEVLLKIVQALDLKGNFQSLEIFSTESQQDMSISQFATVFQPGNVSEFDFSKTQILKSFVDEEELITWLREKTKEVKDLQALCDLAMINAGDTPMEVDRVSTLLGAVLGFSPLLFDVENIKDIKALTKRSKAVISNCTKDPKLESKWTSIGSQVEWIKQIETFYGSDHVHAMGEAKIINEIGIYIITCKDKHNPVVEDCIEMRLRRQGSVSEGIQQKSSSEIYKLADLHDLQSKLMLIAGEKEDGNHVTAYVNLLTAVESLAQVFVQLVTAGCMLFENWRMDIANNMNSDFTISIKFDEEAPPISGTGKLETIDSITAVMNTILSKWTEQMNKYRLLHYYLNEFNVQQVTYLCKELADNKLASLPDQVFMLLARVKKNTTLVEITQALDEATISTDDDDDDTGNIRESFDDAGLQKIERMKRMVRALVREDDVREDVAKAAVMEKGYEDKDECMDWILISYGDMDEINELAEKFNEEIGFCHEEGIVGAVATVLHDRSTRSLREVMIRLQQEASGGSKAISASLLTVYEKYNADTASLTLRDFLSVEHLGKFLTILGQPRRDRNQSGNVEQPKSSPQRGLKPPLQKGKPNLIICQECDLLMQVLSLYMHNKDQPLPTTSEVLICSEKTNADEVERFFRRAMCSCDNGRNPLFCLAMVHKLSHNVSEAAERIFIALSQSNINREFQLVIFTSKLQHYLTTCFDQYHVDMRIQVMNAEATEYLAKHLRVNTNVWMKSAVCVEKNNQLVKVVYSYRSGVGKSLHVRRLKENLQFKMQSENNKSWHTTTIRFMEKALNTDHVIDMLNPTDKDVLNADTHLIHLDFTPAVQVGIEQFAFNLLILGSIEDSQGRIWQRHQNHMYAVEITEFQSTKLTRTWNQQVLKYLPKIRCLSPKEVVENGNYENCLPMDQIELVSDTIQRPFQYLLRHSQNEDLDDFMYDNKDLIQDQKQCINTFLKYCSIKNPSWAQVRHFASFLNIQLRNCEKSIFCDKKIVGELGGLKSFAVSFMIKMAQDFATPSLSSADQSEQDVSEEENAFDHHQLRRRWEESSHPYIFFNDDGISMTFINVNVTREGHLVDRKNEIITQNAISQQLRANLIAQGVPLGVNFDSLNRAQKLIGICQVMGIKYTSEEIPDPDPTYELTTDNVLKILAIYMRFKCQIPVIIMGETGCGKTRMVEFISRLKAQNPASGAGAGKVKTMITLKVHGGVTVRDVHQSIEDAEEVARNNIREYSLNTILFFDEANTTESIYAIKEVVCDLEVNGKSFQDSELQIVAACNPYKKLSDEAIKKLENSGLGYRVRKEDTKDKLGSIPMRTLVYRVVALPPSMQPFVWDFGQLSDNTEKIYIEQMMKKLGSELKLTNVTRELLSDVLSDVQCYMRKQKDETRYVSLRDVERCMITYEWFWDNRNWLYEKVEDQHERHSGCRQMDEDVRTLIQVLGVCYHASLDDRKKFRVEFANILRSRSANVHCYRQNEINDEIKACQKALVKDIKIEKDIALNEALIENVFMITICADMRIPLFVVGKPGSSKSLAKTIVSDNMRGPNSASEMFKKLKQVQVVSFQCSALTHATGIESVFSQCVRLQESQDITKYSAVVVLDEIGLAEDSPNMPLKVLHPLLESGSTKSEILINNDQTKKVAFVGISNWSLDPAKMNRGLFVTRKIPSEEELRITTEGIFSNTPESLAALNKYVQVIKVLTSTYLKIYKKEEREYFGLRDFYSLMKMVRCHCMGDLTIQDVMTAVQRNFSGGKFTHVDKFEEALERTGEFTDMDYSVSRVQNIVADNLQATTESRYLLLLTNQYSAINLLHLIRKGKRENVQVIFGSSFPGDKNYTEICRNINRIKICMEAGSPAVILNLTEIHESLYDALNQHYVTFGDQKYVDLGLGGHRVKSRVHADFKMIIVEKKEVVYEEYPIPLINRLEKHHFDSKSLLMRKQEDCAKELERWVEGFTSYDKEKFEDNEAFLGFHDDTVSSVILICDEKRAKCIAEHYQQALLQSATMDAIFRLPRSKTKSDVHHLQALYLHRQSHDSLIQLLQKSQNMNQDSIPIYEVTTYSNILSEKDRTEVEKQLALNKNSVMLLSLQQFETEQQFSRKLDDFFKKCQKAPEDSAVLLIQCSQAHLYRQLISCARYCLTNKFTQFLAGKNSQEQRVTVAFLLSTDRQSKNECNESLVLQHTTDGEIIYIDELRPTMKLIGPASFFFDLTLHEVFEKSLEHLTSSESPEFLDIVSLLKDCLCEAIDKLQLEKGERNLERISILNRLFDQEGKEFTEIVIKKISEILTRREKAIQHLHQESWMISEAFSRKHLLEGGTFRKTIWLCLKHHTAQYLAYITSIIDSNNNLDILDDSKQEAWVRKMWLAIFEKYSIPWDAEKEKEMKVSYSLPQGSYEFQIPFISMIFRELRGKWKATCDEFQDDKKIVSIFLNTVRDWPIYYLVKEAYNEGGNQMVNAFISDVVRLAHSHDAGLKPEDEIEAIDKIANYFVKSKCCDARDEEYYQPGDEPAIVFLNLLGLQIFLRTLSDIFKTCPDLIKNVDEWISEHEHPAKFEIHEYALIDMMALIRERSIEIKDAAICKDWIELVRKAKKVFRDHIKTISDENKKKITENWKPISFLYYFLTQILPSMSDEKLQNKYIEVIAKQAKLLSKGCKQRDLQSKEYLRILCGTIGKCFEEVQLKLLVSWEDTSCKICKKRMQNPRILPCGHFLCVNCARTTSEAESSTCPACANRIPKDYKLEEVALTAESAAQLSDFKLNCTSFFLRYLTKFTFGQEKISDMEVPTLLVKEILLATDGKQELKTFALDMNVNFRSLILGKILQKKVVSEDITAALSRKDFDIMMAALKYYEWERLDADNEAETQLVTRCWNDRDMQLCFTRLCEYQDLNLNLFETIVRIRLGIKAMSCYIHDVMEEDDIDEMQDRIQSIIQFLDQSDILKSYFIKCGCVQFGTEWFEKLQKNDVGAQLIPTYLATGIDALDVNYMMLTGGNFTAQKLRLHPILSMMKIDELKEVFWCLNEYDEVEELTGALVTLSWLMQHNDLERGAACLKEISISENSLPDLLASTSEFFAFSGDFEERETKILMEFLTMVSIVISKQKYLIKDFLDIVKKPETLQSKFLPAMPESVYFMLEKELRTKKLNVLGELHTEVYTCPNGHIYVIGNCTHPVLLGKCNECGAVIGGINYKLAAGNKRFDLEEETQAGYMLEEVKPPRQNMAKPEDRMSKQGVAVTQAILHSTMILALWKNSELVSSFSKIPDTDASTFILKLITSLLDNLRDLSTALAKNMDDTLIIMHKILLNILRTEGPENGIPEEKFDWSSIESRKLWEQLFRHYYLVPVFQNIDEEIADGLKLLSESAEEFCKNSLYRVTHDLPLENLQQEDAIWSNPLLWKTIVHPTSAHLLQTIQDKPNEQSAILQLVLSNPNLSLLRYLMPVLQLQKQLIEKNQYKLDMNKADNTTFQQYLENSVEDQHRLQKAFDMYFEAWRMVYPLLTVKLQNNPDANFCVNMNSSISLALPSKRGLGYYAKMLVEQLIDIQNEFLSKCAEKIPGLSLREVAVSDLHATHLARIDKHKDLLPLIRMHTNYHIKCDETGTQHQISYNISALEKTVREKFILYKKQIERGTIPCIQYPQDIGIGSDWKKMRDLITQVPLDAKLVMNVDMSVQHVQPADLYEGVRTLTHAISFLSKVRTDPERCLSDYMVKDLMFSAGRISVIPKHAEIRHTLALYQRLSWHKAKQFITQGLNPYQESLPQKQQEDIPEDLADRLQTAFAETKVSLLQQRLNEILIKKPDFNGDWSLIEQIFPFIDDYIDHNPEDDSWYKRLPEELCFKHIVDLFKLTVQYERDNK